MNRLLKLILFDESGNKYITIPQYLLSTSGNFVNAINTAANWNLVSGPASASVSDDAVNRRDSATSLKMSIAEASVSHYIIRSIMPVSPITGPPSSVVRLSFYVDPTYVDKRSITISFLKSFAEYYYNYSYLIPQPVIGWNTVDIYPSQWIAALGYTGNVTGLQIDIYAKTVSVSFDSLQYGGVSVPGIFMTFDDASASVYTEAYGYMHNFGARGTFYVDSGIGGVGGATVANLLEMDAAGWCISPHISLNGLDQAQQVAALQAGTAFVDGMGMTKASLHTSYVGGTFDDATFTAMPLAGMRSGRNVIDASAKILLNSYGDMAYVIPNVISMSSTYSLAQAKAAVDAAVASKYVVGIYGHILAAAAGANTWSISDFRSLIDYCVGLGLPFLTVEDLYNLRSGSIRVRI